MEPVYIDEIDRAFKKIDIKSGNEWKSEFSKKINDSLDSGIVKDPNYISSVNNNKNVGGCNETESSEDLYIVDPTSRKTYIKNKFLGKGGFARVHELLDLTTMCIYAGKIIPKNRITKRQHMEKIAREILIHRGLEHKNVVRLHHFFEDSINAYIILENCSRKSLVHVLKHRQTVTEPEVRYYLKQLVAGVQYIHSQQVIHRDLKPGNMLLTEQMVVKVGDFGLATTVDADSRVTICGTPNYIAPEVLNKLSYSYEADIWAIGCIMYALLVGQPPFETATLKETYSRILTNTYCLPTSATDHAQALVYKLLRPDPTERPTLEAILESSFFRTGFMPQVLSPICCISPPMFPVVNEEITSCGASFLCSRSAIVLPLAQDLHIVSAAVNLLKISPPPASSDKPGVLIEKLMTRVPTTNVGHYHLSAPRHNTLKQKLSSVLCSDILCRNGKQTCNAVNLYENLVACFNSMPKAGTVSNPPTVENTPLFVSKWIDYSNKYGFGFQLSDRSVGVLFNDNTRIAFTPDRSRVEFHDIHGKVSAHPQHSVPAPLGERLTLLRYFGQYMDKHLTEGGDIIKVTTGRNKSTVPHMRRWVRTNTAIVMELCSGTLQINFFKDHTKVIISGAKQGYLVTYINSGRQSRSYWLHNIAVAGCDVSIYERLRFAAAVLREFVELEGGEGV